MTQPLFSDAWYRVAALTPRLRGHATIHRHQYRGQTWYVVEDRASQRFLRCTQQALTLLGGLIEKPLLPVPLIEFKQDWNRSCTARDYIQSVPSIFLSAELSREIQAELDLALVS